MPNYEKESKPLTREACFDVILNEVFALSPPKYTDQKTLSMTPGLVGLEIENFAFRKADWDKDRPTLVPLYGKNSLTDALAAIAKEHDWPIEASKNRISTIRVGDMEQLSFEPGGQFEFSSAPAPSLAAATKRLEAVTEILLTGLADHDIQGVRSGINPWFDPDKIGLQMDKPRYQAMNRYFNNIGDFGKQMMRQTCTVQVNLDYSSDERTLAKRYLAANLIAPFASAIFAYSSWSGGKKAAVIGARAETWRHIDPSRTGIQPLEKIANKMTRQSCAEQYYEFVLASPVVFIEGLDFSYPEGISFGQWLDSPYKGLSPNKKDFETHLSLHFPEVRPRGFIELRSVDAQARVWQAVPAAFYTALLYVPEALDRVIDDLLPEQANIGKFLKLASHGLLDPTIAKQAKNIMKIALESFGKLPKQFSGEAAQHVLSTFAETFTFRGITPANQVLELADKTGNFLPSTLRYLEDQWLALVE